VECYKKAIELEKSDEVFDNLFHVLYQAKNYPAILKEFEEQELNSFKLKEWQIKSLAMIKRFDKAFSLIDELKLRSTDMNHEESLTISDRIEEIHQDIQSKHDHYRIEIDIAKKHIEDGLRYEYEKDLKKSVESYNKAIELNPRDPLPYYNVGVIYSKLGNKTRYACCL